MNATEFLRFPREQRNALLAAAAENAHSEYVSDIPDAWHELEVLRRDASTFLGFVTTVRSSNTEEWMTRFVEMSNRFAMLAGERGEFIRENDQIRWVQAQQSTGP